MSRMDKTRAEQVQAAKIWLEKAEQSFENQSAIKGELNLMLAEAEMKHLRKGKKKRSWRTLSIAAVLIICGIGGLLWQGYTHRVQPTLPAISQGAKKTEAPAKQLAPVESSVTSEAVSNEKRTIEIEPEVTNETPILQADTGHEETSSDPVDYTPPAAEPVLTNQQFQQAVQDARHSLRSTEMNNK